MDILIAVIALIIYGAVFSLILNVVERFCMESYMSWLDYELSKQHNDEQDVDSTEIKE